MEKKLERFTFDKKEIIILVVDDSPTQLFEAKYFLEKEGYIVHSADNGEDALKRLEDIMPTIIITDIVMPKMNGYELCEKIKENKKTSHIPVVLLTSLGDPKDIVKSIEAGASKFLTKPLDMGIINSVITELLFNVENRKNQRLDVGIKILFGGEEHIITSDKVQLLDLLISSYESAYSKNKELISTQNELEKLNLQLESEVQKRTKELEAQRKVAVQEAVQNQLILDSAGDGIFGIDDKEKIYFINKKACELLGYKTEEVIGRYAADVIHHKKAEIEEFSVQNEVRILDTLKTGKSYTVEDEMFQKKDKSYFYAEYIVSPINLENGLGAVVVFRDVSEKVLMEQQIKDKDKMLLAQSRQAAMGDMIAMIAHQWRQPLSIISMIVNNILFDIDFENNMDPEQLKEDMEHISEQSQHLSKTIDDFRNFFKPNKKKVKITVLDVFKDTLVIIGKSLENYNVKVDFVDECCDQTELELHAQELSQVFLNILGNAKDAISNNEIKEGKISVDIQKKDNSIITSICDNAGGIPDDIIGKIGEPYFTTKTKNGTGLGLYMSKIIVQKHLSGKFYWFNKEEGACFIIELPLDELTIKD